MKGLTNIIKVILFCFALVLGSYTFSQEEEIIEEEIETSTEAEKQIISISELAELMKVDAREIIISDYEIMSTNDDDAFLVDKVFFSLYQIKPDGATAKKIYFYNCTFNLNDDAPLVFSEWEISRLNLIGCEFLSPIKFENFLHNGKYPFLIENCIFHDEIEFSSQFFPSQGISFINNEFNANLIIDVKMQELVINNCSFNALDNRFTTKDDESTYYQLQVGEKYVDNIELTSNVFDNKGVTNIYSINFESSSIGKLSLISNRLNTINLSGAEIEKSLLIDSLIVTDYIGILNFDFPEKNTNASWYNISGEKFAVFYTSKSGLIIPYQAKSHEQLADNLKYNDLISAYSKFNALYHDRGDIASANSSYVEIKDIETRKQAYVQTVNPTFNNLINYKLNVFLKLFSDYATNPGKSLKKSLWVLLIFTFLYMLSFSRWDGMNYKYYVRQFRLFSDYITSNSSFAEILAKEKHKQIDDIKDVKDFIEEYKSAGKKVPRILKLFGDPLIFLGKFRYKLLPNLIGFFNFQPHTWNGIENVSEKIWRGAIILIISFVFVSYIIVVKFINSLIMSINSFVVIGFGSLPEADEKFAMYLSIIEGVIGWFLLTIFTITLLSQVLQSV